MTPLKYTNLLVVCSTLLLGACSEHSDLRQWMADVKQQAIKSHPAQTVPSVNAMATYTPPNFSGLDAFNGDRLKAGRQSSGGLHPNLDRKPEILEAFGLEKLEYVGLMEKNGQTIGFIRVDGLVYTVKPGNYLGQNFGRITAIEPDRIVLQELAETTDGSWQTRAGSITRSDSAAETK